MDYQVRRRKEREGEKGSVRWTATTPNRKTRWFSGRRELFEDNSISRNSKGVTPRFKQISQSMRKSGISTAPPTPVGWTEDPDGRAVRIARGGEG